jgi:aminomethyltransferase
MVAFAGWSLPVQYSSTLAEHHAARNSAALFDVSHMGQVSLTGADAAAALEHLVPGDILGLRPGRQLYTLFLNPEGGIMDDLMVAHYGDRLFLVVNAACAEADIAHLRAHLVGVQIHDDRALLALQGPKAAQVLARHAPEAAAMRFMDVAALTIGGAKCWVSRSGYTGEDGYEISVLAADADRVAELLLAEPETVPAGLAARDTLRLEAGLCLYGNDIDTTTTPVEAGLAWAIGKRRRAALDFPGATIIAEQLTNGPARRRVGLLGEGRAPARAGTAIVNGSAEPTGTVTSGTFSPTLGSSICMGYVRTDLAADSTALGLMIRGHRHPACVSKMPFVPHRYAR